MHPLIIMFVLLKRKEVEERGRELGRGGGGWKRVHEKGRTALHGVDTPVHVWTKAFDHHTS